MKVEKLHDFHNLDYVRNWAETKRPTPERLQLFSDMLAIINKKDVQELTILEIGSGPGFLAEYLLGKLQNVNYTAFDFSKEMIQIAKERLGVLTNKCHFIHGDLTQSNWKDKIINQPNFIITTWTLHDLFNTENIKNVYQDVFDLLPKDGMFLNGDFIKHKNTKFEYEGGRITINDHLILSKEIGFYKYKCINKYESNIDNPTPSNNYALMKNTK